MKPERFREIVAKTKIELPVFNHVDYGEDEFIYDQENGLIVNISPKAKVRRIGFNTSKITLADFRHLSLSDYKAFGL